jgi:hypothetical protein
MTARWRQSALNHGVAQLRRSDAPGIARRRRDSRACGNANRATIGQHMAGAGKDAPVCRARCRGDALTSVVHREPGMTNEDSMERAIDLALELHALQQGGPFGAVIESATAPSWEGCEVTSTNDVTAHAEVVAIPATVQSGARSICRTARSMHVANRARCAWRHLLGEISHSLLPQHTRGGGGDRLRR